jgi:hypothetical protein
MTEKPPDFSSWNTNRIKFLLAEYRGNLPSMRALCGRKSQETEALQAWVDAMEKELSKRQQN